MALFMVGCFSFVMALSLLTLNTGGCSAISQNASFKVFVDHLTSNPDIVFLQETYQLNENSSCWREWSYVPFCSPSSSRGSGVTTLLNSSKIECLSSLSVCDGYILYHKICFNRAIYHIYNTLIPHDDRLALRTITALHDHVSSCNDGTIVIGGDFNCTENPVLDRFHMSVEHRAKVSVALKSVFNSFSLCDTWRRLNPGVKKFTWFRNNSASVHGASKSRLDRFYVPLCLFSSVHSCDIIPCSLSDHSAVLLKFKPPSIRGGSAYWHFNNTLLEDENYREIIKSFWLDWQKEKNNFVEVASWWDFGKVHIKSITQMYSSKIRQEKRSALFDINRRIDELQSTPDFTLEIRNVLAEQRDALNLLLKNEAQGALIRSRFRYTNESVSCSSFFFNLEKSNSNSKNMSRIRLPSGCITEDPNEIRMHVRNFYESLYSSSVVDKSALEYLLPDSIVYDPSLLEDLEDPLSEEEFDVAVQHLGKNKSPGLDGLTSEFFQVFWPTLRDDFFSVICSSFESGALPPSLRRAVITLLPKKGDLADVSNWRPVSLLNTDYKILAKVLAARLTQYIGNVIGEDQTYCIPGRSIYDNINLIRDAIFYANAEDIPLALINLDQKKAFDNVDHSYLFNVMKKMGFGDRFIFYIQTLYEGAESLIKVSGSLTSPFLFEKGIRQGCPLSGLLYTIAIEPFLVTLRNTLINHGLCIPGTNVNCAISAYADDVTVFITSDPGFAVVEKAYDLFSRASAACLNTQKSQGLWVGRWMGRNDSPLNFMWNNEGLPFLGVHLGNTINYVRQNWSKCKDKLIKTFASWSRLVYSLSFKGKVLIANQLAASKVFHCLAVLSPPDNILNELQNLLVDFVWSKKRHMLKKSVLFEQPDKGGLGLVCLQARVFSFRFGFLQRFFNLTSHPAYLFMKCFFRQYCKLGYDYQLFHVEINPKFLVSLPVFYGEVLRAWMVSGARIDTRSISFNYAANMPLTCFLLPNDNYVGCCPPARPLACGAQLVRHLLDPLSGLWLDPSALHIFFKGLRPPSLRLLRRELQHLRLAIASAFPAWFNELGCKISTHVDLQTISSFPSVAIDVCLPMLENGSKASSKSIYRMFNKIINKLSDHVSHWHRIGSVDESTKLQWALVYKLPTSKKEGDVQFKLFHNILPSLTVLHHINPDIFSRHCGWCKDAPGTIEHLFIQCPAIQPVLTLLSVLLNRLFPSLLLNFDLYWSLVPCAGGRSREAVRLANFLIISCKCVIYTLFRTNSFSNPVIIWQHRLKSRILYEFHYYHLCHNVDAFLKTWSHNNTLFLFDDCKLIWLF